METGVKYIANITTLFSDLLEHTEKYEAAKNAGFSAVEAQNPYQNALTEWRTPIDTCRLPFVLINTPVLSSSTSASATATVQQQQQQTGTGTGNECPAVNTVSEQTRERMNKELEDNLRTTIDYCRILKPEKVHVILGDSRNDQEFDFMKSLLRTAVERLSSALPEIVCVIEPLSIRDDYYLRSYDTAIELVKEINHPSLKIMLDTYHLQRLHGPQNSSGDDNTSKWMVSYIERLAPYIGHVQISQVPGRDSPLNKGEVCFETVIPAIRKVYSGSIGLEYFGESSDNFAEVLDYLNNL